MANHATNTFGQFLATLQTTVNEISDLQRSVFLNNGSFSLPGPTNANGYSIEGVSRLSVGTLQYTALDPPISAGGNVSGPSSSTTNGIVLYANTTGGAVKNSTVTVSDDAKIAGPGGTIDLSASGTISLLATAVKINGGAVITNSSVSVTDSDIAVFDSTSGAVIKTSGFQVSAITSKMPISGGTFTGAVNMNGNAINNISALSGGVKTSIVNDILTCASSSVADSEIVVFNSTTGKQAKASGVLVSAISSKLALAGGSMSGDISLGGNNLNLVRILSGSIKSSVVNDILTSAASSVSDYEIPLFSGTSGRILKGSGMYLTYVVNGPISAGNNAIARFDSITGTLIKNSAVSISDDAKIAAAGGTIDMSTAGSINLIASNVLANGVAVVTANDIATIVRGPSSSVNDNIATYNSTTGKLLKDSGVAVTSIAGKLSLTGGTMSGVLDMAGNNINNGGVFFGTQVDANSAVPFSVGGSNASALTLGRAGIVTSIAGIAAMTQSYASWYSNTNTSPNFTANVNRTIDIANTSSSPIEFTINPSTGELTYTGTRTRRFAVVYNISLTLPSAISSPLIHFIAVNAANPPVLGTFQTRIQNDITMYDAGHKKSIVVADIVRLSTGDLVRLCGSQSNTNNSCVYNYVSINVIGMLN